MPKHGLIIVAAGSGERMKLSTPKALLPLNGVPLVLHTVRAFEKLPIFTESILVVSKEIFETISPQLSAPWRCILGGASRQESMGLGLAALSSGCDYVWVHDGARPFLSRDLLLRLQKKIEEGVGCIAAIPANDTVKKVKEREILETLDRRELYLAQTPQVFSAHVLRTAVERAKKEGWTVTDEASMVERAGGKVEIVLGEATNIKITTQNDLILGEFLAKQESSK